MPSLIPQSREDFAIVQFPYMKKIMKICATMFDYISITTDPTAELSPMMRTMVPQYYVDPVNPEHPGAYLIAGQSNVSYLERLMVVAPFANQKGKYEYDLSAYNTLLINTAEFSTKTKDFRKTKLEPLVLMGEQNGERFTQSLIMREGDTKAKDEYPISFLHLPNRKSYGEDAYHEAVETLVFKPCYQYLYRYLHRGNHFIEIPKDIIEEMKTEDVTDLISEEGDTIIVAKSILPNLKNDSIVSLAKVKDPDIDTSGGKNHYIIREESIDEDTGSVYMTIYTLLAALSL